MAYYPTQKLFQARAPSSRTLSPRLDLHRKLGAGMVEGLEGLHLHVHVHPHIVVFWVVETTPKGAWVRLGLPPPVPANPMLALSQGWTRVPGDTWVHVNSRKFFLTPEAAFKSIQLKSSIAVARARLQYLHLQLRDSCLQELTPEVIRCSTSSFTREREQSSSFFGTVQAGAAVQTGQILGSLTASAVIPPDSPFTCEKQSTLYGTGSILSWRRKADT